MGTCDAPLLRILVVDDNRDAADSLGILLELAGYDPLVCYDGATALELVDVFRPQACLLDLNMPGMDGDELAVHIRERLGRAIPMAALTAMGDLDARRRTQDAGIGLHLVKPIAPDRLMNVLTDLVLLAAGRPGWADDPLSERPGRPGSRSIPMPASRIPPGLFSR